MKIVYSLFAASLVIASASFAAEGWLTNMDEAKKKAVEENKGLLIEFTGSDWCGPCIHFKNTILVEEEFLDAAGKGFVLVELDYPRKKELAPEQKAHNSQYAQAYGVRSYPTVIFTNAEGKPVHRLHVKRTMPNVLQAVEEANKDRIAVDKALNELKKATGEERVGLIKTVFDTVPFEYVDNFYGDLVAEAGGLPGDPTGYGAKSNERKAVEEYRKIVKSIPGEIRWSREKMNDFLKEEAGRKEYDAMLRQRLRDHLADNLFEDLKIDEALSQYGAAIESSPSTVYATEIRTKKERIENNIDELKLTAGQIGDFNRFEQGLDAGVAKDPGKYAKALESYLDGKKLTDSARERIIHPLVYAMIAAGKTDEALAMLQKVIDGMDEKSAVRHKLTMFRQMTDANKAIMEERLKKGWEEKQAAK